MSQEVADKVRRAQIPTIAINTTFRLAPWADMLYAADSYWWAKHAKETADFAGMKVTSSPDGSTIRGLLTLRNTGKAGFDPHPANVRSGGNSGYQAIHVAVHAHAARILLCGFDQRGGHWHGRHPEPLRNAGEGIYDRWARHFAELATELLSRRIEVWNCTPGSALKCWPAVALEDAIEPCYA
jgi:hypothetical protein